MRLGAALGTALIALVLTPPAVSAECLGMDPPMSLGDYTGQAFAAHVTRLTRPALHAGGGTRTWTLELDVNVVYRGDPPDHLSGNGTNAYLGCAMARDLDALRDGDQLLITTNSIVPPVFREFGNTENVDFGYSYWLVWRRDGAEWRFLPRALQPDEGWRAPRAAARASSKDEILRLIAPALPDTATAHADAEAPGAVLAPVLPVATGLVVALISAASLTRRRARPPGPSVPAETAF
jgi:hypothetical protein